MNGITAFVANFDCGCVVSKRAIAGTKASDVCLGCNGPMRAERMIELYPDDETLAIYEDRLAAEPPPAKRSKKEKKLVPADA